MKEMETIKLLVQELNSWKQDMKERRKGNLKLKSVTQNNIDNIEPNPVVKAKGQPLPSQDHAGENSNIISRQLSVVSDGYSSDSDPELYPAAAHLFDVAGAKFADEEKWKDSEVALQHLHTTGEIFWFKDNYKALVFPDRRVVINTFRVVMDHKLQDKMKQYVEEHAEHGKTYCINKIKQGIITKSTLEKSFDIELKKYPHANLISQDKFEEIMVKLNMAKRHPTPEKLEDAKTSAQTKGGCCQMLIIPSLINNRIENYTKGKSTEEVYDQFKDHLMYTFKFGNGKCFASTGLFEAFLIQLYNAGIFPLKEMIQARCFRENLECRIPGIVFAFEIELENERITLIEEEKRENAEFYKTRLISIFMKPGKNTQHRFKGICNAMENAKKGFVDEYSNELHGLVCFKCMHQGKEGYFSESDANEDWDKITCMNNKGELNEGHKIDYKMVCDEKQCKDKSFVIKRLAYAEKKLTMVFRIFTSTVDVVKDIINGRGYITTALDIANSRLAWEVGFTLFLGCYTLGGMFAPFLAYAIMFSCLIGGNGMDWKWEWFYVAASLTITPLVGLISFFHSLFDKRLVHAAESAHFIERSTESSWQFIVQLVGLTSGAIRHDDYVFQFTTLAGKTVGLPQGVMTTIAFVWSLFTMVAVLLQNKYIYRDRANKERTLKEQLQLKSIETTRTNSGDQIHQNDDESCRSVKKFWTYVTWELKLTAKYVMVPVVKVLPTIAFRVLSFWIILTCLSEYYIEYGLIVPATFFSFICLLTHAVGLNLNLKWKESFVNSVCTVILPVYVDLYLLEEDKKRSKSKEQKIKEPMEEESTEPRKLDWHREPYDLPTKFLNKTVFFGNIVILTILIIVLILVNECVLSPPPQFILLPYNSSNTSTCHEYGDSTLENSHFHNEFYLLNLVTLCIICPLGLASIFIARPKLWIRNVQRIATWEKRIVRKEPHVDVLKALMAIVCTIALAAILIPIGVSVAHFTETCHETVVYNLVSIFLVIGCGSIALWWLQITNIMFLIRGKKRLEDEIKKRKRKMKSENLCGSANCNLKQIIFTKMMCSLFLTIATLSVTITYIVKTLLILDEHCSTYLQALTYVLIIVKSLIVFLSLLQLISYKIQHGLCTENHLDDTTESIPLNVVSH